MKKFYQTIVLPLLGLLFFVFGINRNASNVEATDSIGNNTTDLLALAVVCLALFGLYRYARYSAEKWLQKQNAQTATRWRGAQLINVRLFVFLTVFAGFSVTSHAQVWIHVGNPGNPADGPAYGHNGANQVGRGSVAYEFDVAESFVTLQEYVDFLNAVDPGNTMNLGNGLLYTVGAVSNNGSAWTIQPLSACGGSITMTAAVRATCCVNGLSFNCMARYANWKATGDINTGAYTFAAPNDGNANISAINNNFYGPRLMTVDEYYKTAFWDQANNTYNLYGTTQLNGMGEPVLSGLNTSTGAYTVSNGHLYLSSYCDFLPKLPNQGGKSPYGCYMMCGGYHNLTIPLNPSFPVNGNVIPALPGNEFASAIDMSSQWGATIDPATSFPSPSLRLAKKTAPTCTGGLLANWSFEDGTFSGGVQYGPLPGWMGNATAGTNEGFDPDYTIPEGLAIAYSTAVPNVPIYQEVAATVGNTYSMTFYAAMHDPDINDGVVVLQYYDSGDNPIGSGAVFDVTYDIESTWPTPSLGGPYTLNLGAAPANAAYVRVSYYVTVLNNAWDAVKVDAFCLTTQTPTSCTGNLIQNPSYETGDFTGWTITPGYGPGNDDVLLNSTPPGPFTNVQGLYYGVIISDNMNNPNVLYQDVAATPGTVANLSVYAAVHNPANNSEIKLQFLNASNTVLGESVAQVDEDVDISGSFQLYSLSGTAPAGTTKIRVVASTSANTYSNGGPSFKTDAWCLTLTSSCTQPSAITFTQTAPTCNGATPNNNGTISLATVTNGTHYGVSTLNAGTYDGPAFAMAAAIPGTTAGSDPEHGAQHGRYLYCKDIQRRERLLYRSDGDGSAGNLQCVPGSLSPLPR
ncbi:MAG: hypothetical protein U0U46_11425 [Saprospiraceae bacterium]